MQPLAFLSSSLGTTLTTTQPLPQILEKHGRKLFLSRKPLKGRIVVAGSIPSFNKYLSSTCL